MKYDFTADFECTTDEEDCRVWAYAIASIDEYPEIVYGNSLDDFFEWIINLSYNPKIYFHNLKYDGEFIIHYLLERGFEWVKDKKNNHEFCFNTLITGNGLFYKIEVYFKKSGHKVKKVTFLDSLKLLNFSVEVIADKFDLPIRKLKIDYKEKRAIGHVLTDEEVDYITNDVKIMAMALFKFFKLGYKKMTIGSNALSCYKDTNPEFNKFFPVVSIELDSDLRKSYKGGWTYLNPDYQGKLIGKGCVIDKNSMYPSQMMFQKLPIGRPWAFSGKYEYDPIYNLYIQSLSCAFRLKKNKLPCTQLKNNLFFRQNEWLSSSNDEIVNLVFASPDLELFLENYDVENLQYHGGWKFRSAEGLFTDYINQWTKLKIESKKSGNTAYYQISKLFLNSLYGKFGTNPISYQKAPYLEDGVVKYQMLDPETKDPIYLPMASFITSWARNDIIRTAQQIVDYSLEKYGENRFIYSDTDSLHVALTRNELLEIPGLNLDPYELGAWDCESEFNQAKFIRQKCYMEEIDGELNVHIAGLPRKLAKYMTFENFKVGFTTDDLDPEVLKGNEKLRYKHVKGGVILKETDFTIKDK